MPREKKDLPWLALMALTALLFVMYSILNMAWLQ